VEAIKPPHDHHGGERSGAARCHHEAGAHDRVVHEILEIRGLQRHRGVIGKPDDGDKERARREIAVLAHSFKPTVVQTSPPD
jgi:hypothetical protein